MQERNALKTNVKAAPAPPVRDPVKVRKATKEQLEKEKAQRDQQILCELRKLVNTYEDPNLKYDIAEQIGVGCEHLFVSLSLCIYYSASGTVKMARIRNSANYVVAIKQISFWKQPKKEMLITEIGVMQKHKHPCLVNYIEVGNILLKKTSCSFSLISWKTIISGW